MVELLAPAGSLESLQAAVNAGADAVYIGGSLFGARAYADNPDEEHLKQGIEYCHLHGRKLYMTVNTLLKEKELEHMLYQFLLPYYLCGVDGLIVQDLGVLQFLRQNFPGLEIHASTQMTVTSVYGARLLKKEGITRIVPARELSLEEIRRIINETGLEVETFIHGAMCYCYSGQCLLSSMIGGRSGNRGRCAQPCRLPYSIQGSGKSCLLSMKDMCTLDFLPELIDAGIASMKIEGRMKRPEYTAGVVSIYRKYIDLYLEKGREHYEINEEDRRILQDLYNRGGFSGGYYKTRNGKTMMSMLRPNHQGTRAARVRSIAGDKIRLEALEPLNRMDVLELPGNTEITLSQSIKKGELFSVSAGKTPLGRDSVVYRTKNEALLRSIRERFIEIKLKEKIKGELKISHDLPAILRLWCNDTEVTVSDDIAEKAANNPTTEDMVRRQIQKTGNTPFQFAQLDICMEDGLFVSVKGLNELRRKGISLLQEEILNHTRRRILEEKKEGSGQASPADLRFPVHGIGQSGYRINVLVTMREQLEAVLDFRDFTPDTVYLDTLLFGFPEDLDENFVYLEQMISRVKARNSKCFLSFPPVFREMDQRLFRLDRMQALMRRMDGFLLHTVDELSYIREFCENTGLSAELAADDTLYAYNNRAVDFLRGKGVCRRTLPAELNFRELMPLDRRDTELNVYGYQALMQSVQCLTKNTSGCSGIPSIVYLKDRKNAEFPVLNRCPVCCNTIYNSVPLQLGGCREEFRQLNPGFLRLTFTIENRGDTERILKQHYRLLFTDRADEKNPEGTRGHFRRGVE